VRERYIECESVSAYLLKINCFFNLLVRINFVSNKDDEVNLFD